MNTTSTSQNSAFFYVRNLSKTYQMGEVKVKALHNIELSLFNSEFVVLLGASGSGKSTLLNIIGGLDTPSTGEVVFRQLNLASAKEKQLTQYRRIHVGFVFQFYNLIPSLTALENVQIVTDISKKPMAPDQALTMVGLAERLHHFPSQLSGGEQQRVAIARAIAKRPTLLLCDEPTGALDSKTGILVLQALQKINQELGTATVVITHNATIADMADRVIYLRDGRIEQVKSNKHKKDPSDMVW